MNREVRIKRLGSSKMFFAYFIILALALLITFYSLLPAPVLAGTIHQPPNNIGLQVYLPFEDGPGSSIARDVSGNGNNGTLTNMDTSGDWVNGQKGLALEFTANSDNYVILPDDFDLPELTVSLWIKSDDPQNDFVSNRGSGAPGPHGWHLIAYPTITRIVAEWNSNYNAIIYNSFPSNTWKFVTFTASNSANVAKLYVDGEVVGTASWSRDNFTTRNLLLGNGYNNLGNLPSGTPQSWGGVIDEFRIYNRQLSDHEVSLLYRNQSTHNQLSEANLIAHWKFDDGSGTRAEDSTGNGNHGTLTNMEAADWVAGKRGEALEFDGEDDYVNVGNVSAYNPQSSSFTVSAWFKADDTTSAQFMAAKGNALSIIEGWAIFMELSNLYVRVNASNDMSQRASEVISFTDTSSWHHLVMVIDRSNNLVKGYLDGTNTGWSAGGGGASSNSISGFGGIDTSAAMEIGRRSDNSLFFNGSLDDVRIYNTALSADDVETLYRQGQVTYNASQNQKLTDGLIGLWSFDGPDVSTTTIFDRSGNGNDYSERTNLPATRGAVGQAIMFNQADSSAGPACDVANTQNTFSISFWVKPLSTRNSTTEGTSGVTGNSGQRYLLMASHPNDCSLPADHAGVGISVGTNGITVAEHRENHVPTPLVYAAVLPSDTWTHAVVNVDNKQFTLYVNGVHVHTGLTSQSTNIYPGVALGSGGSGWGTYDGSLDDLRIYSRLLSEQEIKQLWSMGRR